MRRRRFLACLSGAATLPLLALPGSTQERIATVGVLVTGATNPSPEIFLKGLRNALAQIGLVEGRNLKLEIRSAQGSLERLPDLAAELVRLKVDVIVAHLTPAAQAAKQATQSVPVVMAGVGDALGTGLVASLARPGGNVTGFSSAVTEIAGKSLELIREVFPSAHTVGVLANEVDPFTRPYVAQIDQSGRRLGLRIEHFMQRPADPQQPAFESMKAKAIDALIVQGTISRQETVDLTIKYKMPSLGSGIAWPTAGGLMSYSANLDEVYRAVSDYVDKILKGRTPAELPVSLPTKFDLVVNMKTAKAIGVTIPESFLTRADEVIE